MMTYLRCVDIDLCFVVGSEKLSVLGDRKKSGLVVGKTTIEWVDKKRSGFVVVGSQLVSFV